MIPFVLLLAAAGTTGAPAVPDCSLAPGWQQQGAARAYDTDSLYEYMDGNSEGYFIYGFQKMAGVSCRKGDVVVHIDVSDMGDSESAYGMFTANRDPRSPVEKIGMGGQIVPRKVIFAKDRYYLEIAAEPEKDHTAALRELALALDKRVPGQDAPPAVLQWFLTEGLQAGTPRLVPQSVLGFKALTRGYVAQYLDGTKAFILPIDRVETGNAMMSAVLGRFTELREAAFLNTAYSGQDKYLGGTCMFRKGNYVAGYTGAADVKTAEALAAKLAARLPEK